MAQKTRFLDSVSVNAFGNVMPDAIITASGGVGDIKFTRANGVTFTLPLAASASSADALTTASVVDNVITFTKGDLSTFPITINTVSASSGIFAQTGSFYATTNNLQISGSVIITGSSLTFDTRKAPYGSTRFSGSVRFHDDIIVGDDLVVKDETTLDKQVAIGYEGNENLFNGYTLSVSQSTDTGAVLVEGAVSISGSLTVTGSSPSINIGTPTDNSYTDGFFSTFNENTRLANALDDISEAFADLAPAKAGILTSTSLTKVTPSTVYSGYLAGGLITDDWYVGFTANQLISSRLSTSTGVSLTSPTPTTSFRAGKKSNFTPSNILEGGVTASITSQSDIASLSIKALNTGTGVTGILNITDLVVYNNLWVKANATISHTMADTGSYKYKLLADNGAGETAETQLFYLGSGTDYPDPSIALGTITSGSASYNDLSGIKYLKTANFIIPSTGSNLFNPVYNLNQFSFSSTYTNNITTGSKASDTPQFGDILKLEVAPTLTAGLSSGQNAPTGTVAVTKPGKTGTYNTSYTLTPQLVNSYISDPSTTINEPFLGESRRYTNLNNAGWTSANALTNGNLQVQNGRLIGGNVGNYSGFTGIQNFYRLYSGYLEGKTGGTFNISTTGFTSLNEWDSGAVGVEVAIILQEDVTGNTTSNKIYDLGRAQQNGPASGNIYGTKIGNVGPLSGNWSLGTNGTIGASGNIILWVKFSSPDLTNTLTNINLTVS